MTSSRLSPIHLANLGAGFDPAAPPGSYGSGSRAVWRKLEGFRLHNGELLRVPAARLPSSSAEGILSDPFIHAEGFSAADRCSIFDIGRLDRGTFRPLYILVTQFWVFVSQPFTPGGWVCVNPRYGQGTVSAITGATNITGSGTNWSTYGHTNQTFNNRRKIKIDGTWYTVATVTNNTQLTLSTPFAGATGSGKTYELLVPLMVGTTFVPRPAWDHLAGQLIISGRAGPTAIAMTPAGLSIEAPTEFIFAQAPLDAGHEFDAGLRYIFGLRALRDGRVVVAGSNFEFNRSRLYYSSHVTPAVWNTSPGGFTDVVALRDSAFSGLLPTPSGLEIHAPDAIAHGVLTGLADPPLRFEETMASVGAFWPATLRRLPDGRSIFLGRDLTIYVFDGHSSSPLFSLVDSEIPDDGPSWPLPDLDDHSEPTAFVDPMREEYVLFVPFDRNNLAEGTLRIVVDYRRAAATARSFLSRRVTAAAPFSGEPGVFLTSIHSLRARNSGAELIAFEGGGPPNVFSEYTLTDDAQSELTARFLAETDDLDGGQPGIDKTVSHLTLWVRGRATGDESVTVSLSRDAGATWIGREKTLDLEEGKESFFHFYFPPMTGERWRLRLEVNHTRTVLGAYRRLTLWTAAQGQVEAVER